VSFNRLFVAATFAIVIAGVAAAFTFLGTPNYERLEAVDEVRVTDLQRIASLLHDKYQNGNLPSRLSEGMTLRDPVTKQTYQYRRLDRKHYVLCAVFAAAESSDRGQQYPPGAQWLPRDWPHSAGRACYELDVTASPPEPPRVLVASPHASDEDDTGLTP
jgi:hypothetical protein